MKRMHHLIVVVILALGLGLAFMASETALAGKGGSKGKPGGGDDGGGDGGDATPVKRLALTGWRVKGGSLTGYPSLHTVGSDGSDLQRLTEGAQWENADWSPDGRYIVARVGNQALKLYHVGTGAEASLASESSNPSWSRRLDASGAVRASEDQLIAAAWNQTLVIHQPFAAGGPTVDTLLSYAHTWPNQYVQEVEWLPQHEAADDTSWILFRLETHVDASTRTSELMMVEVDTSSWPVSIVSGPVAATWAETEYPPAASDDGRWACWAASDGGSLRIAPLQWNTSTGEFLGIGTASSFGSTTFSNYENVREWGASLNASGTRAAVWASTSGGRHDLILMDVDGSNVATIRPTNKPRSVSMYGLKTSWQP